MGNHIFLASQENFEKCIHHGVYGATSQPLERFNSEIIGGFQAIKQGDFIFFYVRNMGIYGLWKATSNPFFDEGGFLGKEYPYRVCFEPLIREFPGQWP